MKAKTFDRKFESGGRILDHVDLTKARRTGTDAKRVNVTSLLGWWNPLTVSASTWGDAAVADQALAGR